MFLKQEKLAAIIAITAAQMKMKAMTEAGDPGTKRMRRMLHEPRRHGHAPR